MHNDANGSLPGGLGTNNRRSKNAQCGFSLIELIVVIAIMAVLVGLLAPQYVKFIREKRHTTCQHNREAILRVYEKCVYDNSIEEATNKDGGAFLNSMLAGRKAYLQEDIKEYEDCPNRAGSHTHDWTGGVSDDGTAYIICPDCKEKLSLTDDDYVSVDIWGMNYKDKDKKEDEITTPTPTPTPTDEPEPTVEPVPTDIPTPTKGGKGEVFPYSSDEEWWDPKLIPTTHPGQVGDRDVDQHGTVIGNDSWIKIKVPTKIFTSNSGARFVFIRTNSEWYKIYFRECSSPETFLFASSNGDNSLIQLSGYTHVVKAEDMARGRTIKLKVSKGDIVKFVDSDGNVHMYVGRQNYEEVNIDTTRFNNATKSNPDNQVGNLFRILTDEEYDARG